MKKENNFLGDVWKKSETFLARNNSNLDLSVDKVHKFIGRSISVGPFYYYALDFSKFPQVEMIGKNESISNFYGGDYNEMTLETLLSRVHPDDIGFIQKCEEYINKAIVEIYINNLLDFKASYCFRIKNKNDDNKLILHQMIPLELDSKQHFKTSINIHTEIEHITTTNSRTLSLFGFNGLPSFTNVDPYGDIKISKNATLFTERETEIIRWMASGYAANSIATELNISTHTVRTHKRNILSKTHCKNQTELIAFCLQEGLI